MAAFIDAAEMRSALEELAVRLDAAGVEGRIRLMGGAAIALDFPERGLTTDADALYQPAEAIEEVAAAIGRERGWSDNWLNRDVKMYASDFDHLAAWSTLVVVGAVSVVVAPPDLLLAMKLRAGRGRRDSDDVEWLLDRCGIGSLAEAEEIFDRYYPRDEIAPGARRQIEARFQ